MKQYWKLEIQMIFALRESLARSDLAKGMSMAERTVSVAAMTRKHVQKPANISEIFIAKFIRKRKKGID